MVARLWLQAGITVGTGLDLYSKETHDAIPQEGQEEEKETR